jgi:hypothetical protein
MSRTYQNVADRARSTWLNDSAKTRWTDAELIALANDGVLLLRRQRPDLFFGSFSALPVSTEVTNGATTLPVPDEFFVPLADFVAARAHGRDSEDAANALVPTIMSQVAGAL